MMALVDWLTVQRYGDSDHERDRDHSTHHMLFWPNSQKIRLFNCPSLWYWNEINIPFSLLLVFILSYLILFCILVFYFCKDTNNILHLLFFFFLYSSFSVVSLASCCYLGVLEKETKSICLFGFKRKIRLTTALWRLSSAAHSHSHSPWDTTWCYLCCCCFVFV